MTPAPRVELPPGPKLPDAISNAFFWGASPRYLQWCRERYGRTFKLRIWPFGTVVVVADPDMVKQIYAAPADVMHAGAGNRILKPLYGKHSMVLVDGAEHLWRRRLQLPMFHGEALTNYEAVVDEVSCEMIAEWPVGRRFPLIESMHELTLEVIIRAIIGVTDQSRLDRLRQVLPAMLDVPPVVMPLWIFPKIGRIGPWKRYRATLADADRAVRDEIAHRRLDPDLASRSDVLSLLLTAHDPEGEPLTDDEVRDALVTLLIGGHETTATALAWIFERLVRNPEVLEKAKLAAESGDNDYLDAVVKEGLRSRPILFATPRKLMAPFELGDRTLPKGIMVSPAISLIQHDPEIFDQPELFRPERFLDSELPSYSWIPFGGGVRRCLGAAFASMEMRVILRNVLLAVELRTEHGKAEKIRARHVTHVPSGGGRVVIERFLTA